MSLYHHLIRILAAAFWFCLFGVQTVQAQTDCPLSKTPIQLSTFKQSKEIRNLTYAQSRQTLSGQVKELGSFQAQLYACENQGVHLVFTFEQIQDESDLQRQLAKVLRTFARPVFGKSAPQFLGSTQALGSEQLLKGVSLNNLSEQLGLSEVKLQLLEIEGMYIMSLKAWGG